MVSASASRAARHSSRTCIMRSLNAAMPLSAFTLERALPSFVRGPVERSHGFQPLMASACFARRSGVHPDLRTVASSNTSFSFILPLDGMRQTVREAH